MWPFYLINICNCSHLRACQLPIINHVKVYMQTIVNSHVCRMALQAECFIDFRGTTQCYIVLKAANLRNLVKDSMVYYTLRDVWSWSTKLNESWGERGKNKTRMSKPSLILSFKQVEGFLMIAFCCRRSYPLVCILLRSYLYWKVRGTFSLVLSN